MRKELGFWRWRGCFGKLSSVSSVFLVDWEVKAKEEDEECDSELRGILHPATTILGRTRVSGKSKECTGESARLLSGGTSHCFLGSGRDLHLGWTNFIWGMGFVL